MSLDNVIKDLIRTEDACGFVNYDINLINRLCTKYGIKYLQSQWYRANNTDEDVKPLGPFLDIDRSQIDVDEDNTATTIWFTGAAYKIAQRTLNLPHKNVTALFSNYVENPRIQISAKNKFNRFQGTAGRGFALRVIDEEALA